MTQVDKPTAVIVHGAWGTPKAYESFSQQLAAHGWTVHCPLLPTCNNARPPTKTRDDDVALIRQLIQRSVDAGQYVLVLMHSYGGIVGSEAVLEEQSFTERSKKDLPGGIVRMVFMSAFIMLPGQSVVEAQGFETGTDDDKDARTANSKDMDAEYYEDGTCKLLSAANTSFTLLKPEEREYWASELPVFPVAAGMAKATRTPWKSVPTTYAYGKLDNSILLPIQEKMVKRCNKDVGICDLKEEYLETDHSP